MESRIGGWRVIIEREDLKEFVLQHDDSISWSEGELERIYSYLTQICHYNGGKIVGNGKVDKKVEKLLDVTQKSLYQGIEKAIAGKNLSDIGSEVQKTVEKEGFSVVRELVGHGIGRNLHEDPEIPNFGTPGKGPKLKKGMCLAIEPMVNIGNYEVETLDDGWTVIAKDGSRSAHFEHTITITDNRPIILADKKIKVK